MGEKVAKTSLKTQMRRNAHTRMLLPCLPSWYSNTIYSAKFSWREGVKRIGKKVVEVT